MAHHPPASTRSALRALADQAFSRAGGAPLVPGNALRVLRDARENYPAWEAAIRAARHTIHLEMYIVHRDAVGRRFVDLLAAKAREGVTVRVIYDWFGCGIGALLGLFDPIRQAGGHVRAFNPPTLTAMFGWIRRNHRKLLVVDSDVAYVGGLCIGQAWEGTRTVPPWRDTALELRGPVVAHVEHAFADSWAHVGGAALTVAVPPADAAPAGDVDVRLIATEPFTASMFRLDLLVAAMARRRLWIADAYFIGHGPFADALCRASQDGVDVRLLLPHGSDVGWTVPVARTLYRTLLAAGVRVYEWTGSMMHAKTAVADSRWARIGSTNLNINSWLGNWELDVLVEDAGVAATMEAHFEEDLRQATEITLTPGGRLLATPPASRHGMARRSARRVVREVTGVARSVGAALTASRPVEAFEVGPLLVLGAFVAAMAGVAVWYPWVVAWPLAAFFVWAAATLLLDAWFAWRRR
jgi:phosphatidylserine/phosphatidylglycerophosphate/cardiolipin synthase-like enzyme